MSVQETVDTIIASNKVTVFSKSWCGYSSAAKATLSQMVKNEADIKILELDLIQEGDLIQDYLLQKTGQRTVPNVFINQQHIGGNDDVQAARASGLLSQLLAV